jgi:SAM-dependent methyltransferase
MRAKAGTEPISILNLGCSPLAQVRRLGSAKCIQFTCVDGDERALNELARNALAAGIEVRAVRAELTNLTDTSCLADDYAGCCGLQCLNYLSDAPAISLLNLVHSKLRPAGRLLLANFSRVHANTALLEHGLSWPLVARSEPELLRLIKKTKFAGCAITLSTDPEGVQLFVECRKSAA